MVENTITDKFTNFNFSGGDFFSTLIFQGMAYFVKFLIHQITYEMYNKIYDLQKMKAKFSDYHKI